MPAGGCIQGPDLWLILETSHEGEIHPSAERQLVAPALPKPLKPTGPALPILRRRNCDGTENAGWRAPAKWTCLGTGPHLGELSL